MCELLAPAGSFACAEAAFEHGADAVYAGIDRFNLRAHSPNFTVEEFGELIMFANGIGKKVYGVLNIMPNDEMFVEIEETLKRLAENGHRPHAFIVSDPGVLSIIRKIFVDSSNGLEIHLSTQNGCFNTESMNFWRNQGISRVILPRELNIDQIRRLSSSKIMETEIFVHGAMCVSVSGRCLLGTYYNRRHPNLGDCPQPCRFKYRIIPAEQDGVDSTHEGFDAEESAGGVYLLNSKDLCTIDILPKLMTAGVTSFKIEGRNKSAHYVASVVKIYRDAINTFVSDSQNYKVKDWWREELEAIEHRPYTAGFYADDPVRQELFTSKARAGHRLVGIVKAVINNRPVIDVKNSFSAMSLNVLPVKRGQIPFELTFETIREYDDSDAGTVCERARANRLIILDGCNERLRVGDMLRTTQ